MQLAFSLKHSCYLLAAWLLALPSTKSQIPRAESTCSCRPMASAAAHPTTVGFYWRKGDEQRRDTNGDPGIGGKAGTRVHAWTELHNNDSGGTPGVCAAHFTIVHKRADSSCGMETGRNDSGFRWKPCLHDWASAWHASCKGCPARRAIRSKTVASTAQSLAGTLRKLAAQFRAFDAAVRAGGWPGSSSGRT